MCHCLNFRPVTNWKKWGTSFLSKQKLQFILVFFHLNVSICWWISTIYSCICFHLLIRRQRSGNAWVTLNSELRRQMTHTTHTKQVHRGKLHKGMQLAQRTKSGVVKSLHGRTVRSLMHAVAHRTIQTHNGYPREIQGNRKWQQKEEAAPEWGEIPPGVYQRGERGRARHPVAEWQEKTEVSDNCSNNSIHGKHWRKIICCL